MKNNLILLISFLFLMTSCSSKDEFSSPLSIEGRTMGTYYRIKTFGDEDPKELKAQVDKFLKLFNFIFSTYIEDSEISVINKDKLNKIKGSDTFIKLLELSIEISKKSEGSFDVTVGPLVNAWGFGPDGKRKKPTKEQISKLLKSVGYEKISIKDEFISKSVSDVYIDMSAMAKGFGVDELLKFLDYKGYTNILVEIGGEVRTNGTKAGGKPWVIGIEGPSEKLGTTIQKAIPLKRQAMATSGSYRNYIKYGDEIFNHTINPLTGYPVKHKTISVSVIHDTCAEADAWATAFMSMGAEKGIKLANRSELKVYFQIKEKGKIKTISSRAFDKYLRVVNFKGQK